MSNKLCIYCEHFCIENAYHEPGYSSMTPSYHSDMRIYCYKRHWEVDPENADRTQYRKFIETGLTCSDFEDFKSID